MIEITTRLEIHRPPDEVFEVLADMSRNVEWQRGMHACLWTSEPPLRLGSTYDQVARFLGRDIVSSFEVTEFEPGRKIRIESVSGSMPLDITRTVEPSPRGCKVTAVVRGEPSGLFSVARPIMRLMVQRSVAADYRRLKSLLEV